VGANTAGSTSALNEAAAARRSCMPTSAAASASATCASLWIVSINAALKQVDESVKYSRFIKSLKDANIALDRKMLSELAVADFTAFKKVVEAVRK
jgi:ribosomal protein L20